MAKWNGQFIQKWQEGTTVRRLQRSRAWILNNLVAEPHVTGGGQIKYPYVVCTPHCEIDGRRVRWYGGGNGAGQTFWVEADSAEDALDTAARIERALEQGKTPAQIYVSF